MCRAGLASRDALGSSAVPERSRPSGKRPAPKVAAWARPRHKSGGRRTHQLLQVLLRARNDIAAARTRVPGGFGHHHHRMAEAAAGAATTARQLAARLPLPRCRRPPPSPPSHGRAPGPPAPGPERRCPAPSHATTAAQQEASVTSHRRLRQRLQASAPRRQHCVPSAPPLPPGSARLAEVKCTAVRGLAPRVGDVPRR